MKQIQLGDKIRCKITGFVGIAVAKTEFINGCIQWDILPKGDKKNKMPEATSIDNQSLEIITPKKKEKMKKESNGGAIRKASKQRGF